MFETYGRKIHVDVNNLVKIIYVKIFVTPTNTLVY